MGRSPRYGGNQSLQGFVTRLLETDQQNTIWWILSAATALIAGLALATALQRRGEEAMAMVVVGFLTLLISPVSWSHYWLWIAPLAVVFVDVARRSRGVGRVLAAVIGVAALLPFLMWPGPDQEHAGVFPKGLIWSAWDMRGLARKLAVEPYVPPVLLLFVLAVLWMYWQRRTVRTPIESAATSTGNLQAGDAADRRAAHTAEVPIQRSARSVEERQVDPML